MADDGTDDSSAAAPAPAPVSAPGSAPYAGADDPGSGSGGGSNPQQPNGGPSSSNGASLPQPESPASNATIPEQPTQQGPIVLKPVPHTGARGVFDRILDAIAPPTETQTYVDQNNQQWQQRFTQSGAQRWVRVGLEALHGAAAGLAAGRGAGNAGKAALAGWDAGADDAQKRRDQDQAQADRQVAQNRQQKYDQINTQLLRTRLASEQFAATRLGVKAAQEDQEWSEQEQDRHEAKHDALVATVKDPAQFFAEAAKDPNHHADVVNGSLKPVPLYDSDGKAAGFQIWKVNPDDASLPAAPGTQYREFVPPAKPGDQPTYRMHTPSDTISNGEIERRNLLATTAMLNWQNEDAKRRKVEEDIKHTAAETREINANSDSKPLVARSEIAKNNAEAQLAGDKDKNVRGGGDEDYGGLVDQIGTGKIDAEKMSRVIAKQPGLLQAVVAKYPDFDATKVANYRETAKEFTSGKVGTQLNTAGTSFKHLEELKKLNTPMSHIPGTADYRAYVSKATTLAGELATSYGTNTVPGVKAIFDNLTSTLPGSRDRAISTQAESLGDKMDSFEQQWKNAAPSAAYMAKMPQIDDAAKAARAALDPRYKARFQPQAAQAQQGDKVSVQVPGQPPGYVPRAQLQAFKAAYPNAIVNE